MTLGALASLLVFPLLFALAMTNQFSHDEHQHIAGGALFIRRGLLPYRDFPYFHTPYLVFVYGCLFGHSNHLLLIARTFSAACASLTVGALFGGAWSILRAWVLPARIAGASGASLLMLSTPVVVRTVGHAWNQEVSTLFALLAVLLVIEVAPQWRPRSSAFAAGVCLGLAVGFRVTFAPIALPLLCIIAFGPSGGGRSRGSLLAWFSGGAAFALLPMVWLLAIAPEQTLFGTLGFAKANLTYRLANKSPRNISLLSKLGYALIQFTIRGVAPLALTASLAFCWWAERLREKRFPLLALAALAPFLLAGTLAPTPLYPQYFYSLIPFCVLAAVYAIVPLPGHSSFSTAAMFTLSSSVSFSIGLALPCYGGLTRLLPLEGWEPMQVAREAREMRALEIHGPVLTLAPTVPLEAGLDIYPAFATGPFAWRVGEFIDASRRRRLGIVAPSDLERTFSQVPFGAVYVGDEAGHLERDLHEFAELHHLEARPLTNAKTVWVPVVPR